MENENRSDNQPSNNTEFTTPRDMKIWMLLLASLVLNPPTGWGKTVFGVLVSAFLLLEIVLGVIHLWRIRHKRAA